jgi:hypothetical protein
MSCWGPGVAGLGDSGEWLEDWDECRGLPFLGDNSLRSPAAADDQAKI